MEIRQIAIPGTCELVPKKFGAERGHFAELFLDETFHEKVQGVGLVQEDDSLSCAAGTIRGLHFKCEPFAPGKLVRCVQGAVFNFAVDVRRGSPHFGRWAAVELSDDAHNQMWILPGFAQGFCTLVPDFIAACKVTANHNRESGHGFAWNDMAVNITLPRVVDASTLSANYSGAPTLADLPEYLRYED